VSESIEIPLFNLLDLRDCKIALYRAPSNKLADGLTTNKGKEQVNIQLAKA
jgi:dimethylargininase